MNKKKKDECSSIEDFSEADGSEFCQSEEEQFDTEQLEDYNS